MHTIKSVEPGSIADQLDIRAGDALVSINGEKIVDFVDYQALESNERINLVISRNGSEMEFELEKDDYEPLGLEFVDDMLGNTRLCANNCMFCFVDQLPKHCRETMRVKDDDWRLSLMMGNYVTLTNVFDAELNRIIKRGASPLYISVHSTDPELRAKLLGTDKNADIMPKLRALKDGGIQFHAQAVLCPGVNDGSELVRTLDDLIELYPACQSLAPVPVGLTSHREGLTKIEPYTKDTAAKVIEIAQQYQRKCLRDLGTRFVFPSDELFLTAGLPFPSDGEYEDYCQIDNGVGLCRRLISEFDDAYFELPESMKKSGRAKKEIYIATGVSVAPVIRKLLEEHPISGINVKVRAIKNRFFGESVTVSGLVTGGDLIAQMRGTGARTILITVCMLNSDGDRFLDDITLKDVRRELGASIIPVGRSGEDLLNAIIDCAKA